MVGSERLNILDVMEETSEAECQQLVNTFECRHLNPEVEDFLRKKAIDFAKKRLAITYLIVKRINGLR